MLKPHSLDRSAERNLRRRLIDDLSLSPDESFDPSDSGARDRRYKLGVSQTVELGNFSGRRGCSVHRLSTTLLRRIEPKSSCSIEGWASRRTIGPRACLGCSAPRGSCQLDVILGNAYGAELLNRIAIGPNPRSLGYIRMDIGMPILGAFAASYRFPRRHYHAIRTG
jgi:hypothetical protein